MAEIKIQHKGPTIWPWLAAALALLLLVWGWVAWSSDGDETERLAQATAANTAAVATAGSEAIPIAAIMARPADYANQTVSGTTQVVEVISDRGFWLEQQGRRMFAVIEEIPREIVDINPGQTVRLTGRVYTAETRQQIEGSLEPETRQMVGQQPAFLYVKGSDVSIIGRDSGRR